MAQVDQMPAGQIGFFLIALPASREERDVSLQIRGRDALDTAAFAMRDATIDHFFDPLTTS